MTIQILNPKKIKALITRGDLKVNLGCGRNIKPGWINVDGWKRADIDIVCDLSKEFPFKEGSCIYIYSEHFIEHLEWFDGYSLIKKCFNSLEKGGTFRIVFPDFKKLFKAYIDGDDDFLWKYSDGLNNRDLPYYKSVYEKPEEIRLERKNNLPPSWHFSQRPNDRKNLKLRAREYKFPIEVIDWAVHQYGEHKTLYDNVLMKSLLTNFGFSKVYDSEFDSNMDSPNYYTPGCCYIEAIK